jgi:hypothetical protein
LLVKRWGVARPDARFTAVFVASVVIGLPLGALLRFGSSLAKTVMARFKSSRNAEERFFARL